MEETVRNLQSVKHIGGYKEDYVVKEKIRLSDCSIMIGNTHLIGTTTQLGSFQHSQTRELVYQWLTPKKNKNLVNPS
jgi:hypothetical protein